MAESEKQLKSLLIKVKVESAKVRLKLNIQRGREDPMAKGIATHSSILAQEIPWTVEPGGLQPMGLQRVRHD